MTLSEIRIAAIGAVIGLVGLLLVENVFYKKENNELITKNAEQTIINKVQDETINEANKAAVINEEVTTKQVVKTNEIFIRQQSNERRLNKEVADIAKKYHASSPAEVSPEAYHKEVSDARLRSLWRTYCSVAVASATCATIPQ